MHLRINVHDSPHVKGGQRLVSRSARDVHHAADVLYTMEDFQVDDQEDGDPYEADILEGLMDDEPFMRFAARYGLGELACVRVVHEQMFAAIFEEGRTWRHCAILFISMRDHRRILHDLRFIDGTPECVMFRPAEMWYASSSGFINYHGPRMDRGIVPHTLKGDGRITRAFFAVANGRVWTAMDILKTLAIRDLSKVYIPKTTLTLFDIAADPVGDVMHSRNIDFLIYGRPLDDIKADAAILHTPLPPNAALLLSMEPRFAHSVHMMKRAIRAMDIDRVRDLVRAGCPWISHDDVVDALPPGLEYEKAMEMLRPTRLKITYRY